MITKTKAIIILIIAVASLVLGLWFFWQSKNNMAKVPASVNQTKITSPESEKETASQTILPQPAESVDDIASGVVSQIQSEEDNFANEDGDAESAGINQQDLDDFGQSYDENEF